MYAFRKPTFSVRIVSLLSLFLVNACSVSQCCHKGYVPLLLLGFPPRAIGVYSNRQTGLRRIVVFVDSLIMTVITQEAIRLYGWFQSCKPILSNLIGIQRCHLPTARNFFRSSIGKPIKKPQVSSPLIRIRALRRKTDSADRTVQTLPLA